MRILGRNRKKIDRKKHSNQMGKVIENKPEYKEDFNEIILNDLVPQDQKGEFGLEERQNKSNQQNKKSNSLNLSLGLGKKKSSKKSNENIKSKKNEKQLSDNEIKKKQVKTTKKIKQELAENNNKSKNTKKTKKYNHSKKRTKTSNKEKINENLEDVNRSLEEIENNNYIEDSNMGISRNTEDEVEVKEYQNQESENNLEKLVWSEDKFPKK